MDLLDELHEDGTTILLSTHDVEGLTVDGLLELCAGRGMGAMGTRAKQFCHDAGILPDYTYGVVDKCLLLAMMGGYADLYGRWDA